MREKQRDSATVEVELLKIEMAESSNDSESSGTLLETLRRRGWCLEDTDQLKATIAIQSALAQDSSKVLDSVESELLNSDLRSIGAKSLPDPSLLRNPSFFLHGPKVLQAYYYYPLPYLLFILLGSCKMCLCVCVLLIYSAATQFLSSRFSNRLKIWVDVLLLL